MVSGVEYPMGTPNIIIIDSVMQDRHISFNYPKHNILQESYEVVMNMNELDENEGVSMTISLT